MIQKLPPGKAAPITVSFGVTKPKAEPVVVKNLTEIGEELTKASQCDLVMEPGHFQNLKKQIILVLPNQIKSFPALKNLILEIHQDQVKIDFL